MTTRLPFHHTSKLRLALELRAYLHGVSLRCHNQPRPVLLADSTEMHRLHGVGAVVQGYDDEERSRRAQAETVALERTTA